MHSKCLAVLSCLKFWTIFTILVHMGTLTVLSGVTGLWCFVTWLVPGTNMSETGTKADGTRDQIIFNVYIIARISNDYLEQKQAKTF